MEQKYQAKNADKQLVGSTTFTCGKCETTIKTESIPDSDGCLSGGLHKWYKL